MIVFKKILLKSINFFNKNYWLFLFLIVLVSYGQILAMLPWQDDNALFFKLAHIHEQAGFLGKGVFGSGAYKYTAFFYYPTYLLFGHREVFYFAEGLILYALTTVFLYKLVSKVLNENTGKLVGFLYACGLVGSDSFIRLFNSVITSLSIILVCIFLYFYWLFYKTRQTKYYLLGLFVFLLAAEFARARTHYLIAMPVLFELFFFAFKKPFSGSLSRSIIRIFPFLPIFYNYVIGEDARSQEAVRFITSLMHGEFYKMYGFLSSITNLTLPDWLMKLLSPVGGVATANNYLSNSIFYLLIIGILIIPVFIFFFLKNKKFRIYSSLFLTTSVVWRIVCSIIFINPGLVVSPDQISIAYIGGELLLFALVGFLLIDTKYKSLYLFVLMGILINIMSYSAYNPVQVYEKINRYLSHSFLYLVIFFGVLYYAAGKKTQKIILAIVIIWGLNNLVEGFWYQRNVLIYRTRPVRSFYNEFSKYVTKVEKGDIIYFDVQDDVTGNFANAFSVAQMPNTTAIAWRYGVDRDDFLMFENPEDFFGYFKKIPTKNKSIHTFFYSKNGLFETTKDFLDLINNKTNLKINFDNKNSEFNANATAHGTLINKSEVEVSENIKIPSIVPARIVANIIARPLNLANLNYPVHYGFENTSNLIATNKQLIALAFEYKKYKDEFKKSKIEVTSYWQDRLPKNLLDADTHTIWQADRILWLKNEQSIVLGLPKIDVYNRLSFVNSFSDSSPLEFDLFYSNTGTDWAYLKTYKNSERIGNGKLVNVDFPATSFKYFKIYFKKTLNGDSPAISELWLVPDRFSSLNIGQVEVFLNNVFSSIPNLSDGAFLMEKTNYSGNLELLWSNNKKFGWQKDKSSHANIVFDGMPHLYEIPIFPGGTNINKLKFVVTDFPGTIEVSKIYVYY